MSRPVALRAGGPVRTVPVPGPVRRAGRAGRVAPGLVRPAAPEPPPENGATPPLEEASAVYQASALKVYSPVVSAADSTSA